MQINLLCCALLVLLLQWPVATAARWHVQIMMVTVQVSDLDDVAAALTDALHLRLGQHTTS